MKLFESDRNNQRFKDVANKLLNECFLMKKREPEDYLFVIQNREKFSDFFSTIGYAVNIYEHNNVIHLVNSDGNGRIHLKKDDSVMILLLRLLYIEKKKSLSENTEIRITWEEFANKYALLKVSQKPRIDKVRRDEVLRLFRRYKLAKVYPQDKPDDTQIEIYPTILFAIPNSSIDQLYADTESMLGDLKRGGTADEQEDPEEN